ncbi:transcriptional repressor ILP1 [Argentina anserina]|uniref:transcriptional repressor ILP1 n=1 Tax=Argentina anserina TaxID=57926 RepID=UPI0021762A33|nr:transcriptional repressor ILP1 [Potentilla anserina]
MSSARPKNYRRRVDDDDDDDADTPSTTSSLKSVSKPSSSAAKPKKPQNQAPKLLSFADDEDAATPPRSSSSKRDKSSSSSSSRLAKPSSAHKLTAAKDRLVNSSSSSVSNVTPQAGTYTKEALLELQKNTRTLASSRPSAAEPTIVLKGLIKPPAAVNGARELDSDDDEGGVQGGKAAASKLASMEIDQDRLDYPDQATIEAIRKKRERLRKSKPAAPDFIALDSGSNHGAAEGLSDEEPEFRNRIAMFGDKIEGASNKGVFEDVENDSQVDGGLRNESVVVVEDDDDEEEKKWEEEQFRKGLGKRVDNDGSSLGVSASVARVHSAAPQPKASYSGIAGYGLQQQSLAGVPSIGGAAGASHGSSAMSINEQAEIAQKALLENVRKLKESHARTKISLTKADENLSASLLNITALEKSLSAADEKYKFMQELRDFISTICGFLQDKAPLIEELEEEMQKQRDERASAIFERRIADNDDEMMEVEAAVNAAMSIFSKQGTSAELIAVAKSAAQAASAAVREQINLPVKLDEFGRDMNLKKRLDMKGRAEARQRRRKMYEAKRESSMDVDCPDRTVEGESSTDESDSESKEYESHRQLVLGTADQVFSDAAEEYSQLSAVKERFEEWKREYQSSYRDAYMSLSVPVIFSPYVRLELLKWDPLRENTDFVHMSWHVLLENYGVPEDGSDFASDDADANLIPALVEKVALPILHHQIVHCWDILSTRETKNAVAATSLVTDYVSSSEALEDLLVAIRTRLADAVSKLMVPTWSPLVLKAVPIAARIAAYRFGMSVRLMKNICLWKEILALPVLEKLAINELLCGKILPHIRSIAADVHDAVTRTERVIASLSGVWSGSDVTGDRSRKLHTLVDYVLTLRKTIEKKHSLGVTQSETGGLARRLKKMLVELNEYDKARDVVRTFQLKEAL